VNNDPTHRTFDTRVVVRTVEPAVGVHGRLDRSLHLGSTGDIAPDEHGIPGIGLAEHPTTVTAGTTVASRSQRPVMSRIDGAE